MTKFSVESKSPGKDDCTGMMLLQKAHRKEKGELFLIGIFFHFS